MTLTLQERDRLKGRWRELAAAARRYVADPKAEHDAFKALATDALKWLSPLEEYADGFLLFGFARLAAALARTKLRDFPVRAGAVAHVANVVADLLGEAPGGDTQPAARRLPYADD